MTKVLIAGASGVVGYAAMRAFAAHPGWDVVGLARRPRAMDGTTAVAVDLADRASTSSTVRNLGDVTHLVYAALYEKPGLIPGWYEQDQMTRNREMLANLVDPLMASAGALQHISLLQGTKAYGAHIAPITVPARERSPRHQHENFYWLQEDYLRAKLAGTSTAFTIIRPQIIFGDAFGSNMNPIPALGVYAAVLRYDGQPLHYPGGPSHVTEAVDADLLANALVWAATSPDAVNDTFNVTNGDVFTLTNLWPAIADAFGMDVGEARPCSLAIEMPQREATWLQIVERFGLRSPRSLTEFVGQSFIYVDAIASHGADAARPPSLVSTVKIRRAGFGECIDTEDMVRKWIDHFQRERFLPPRQWPR